MKEYGLYDVKDYEQCVCIGNIKVISNFLSTTPNSLRSYITHRKKGERTGLLKRRYELIEITEEGEEMEEDENEEEDCVFEILFSPIHSEKSISLRY